MALFVGRLPSDVRQRELEDLFDKYGKILRCDIKSSYAFVEFEDSRDAEDAVKEMDGYRLSGRPIVVEWAKGKRRGGERASGGGDRDACFKCGEKGHWARECRNSGGGGGSSSSRRRRSRSRSRSRSRRRSSSSILARVHGTAAL
jgi:RNA recognition motif-containing protein